MRVVRKKHLCCDFEFMTYKCEQCNDRSDDLVAISDISGR